MSRMITVRAGVSNETYSIPNTCCTAVTMPLKILLRNRFRQRNAHSTARRASSTRFSSVSFDTMKIFGVTGMTNEPVAASSPCNAVL